MNNPMIYGTIHKSNYDLQERSYVFMLIIPEAKIFHKKNDSESWFYYCSYYNNTFYTGMPSMQVNGTASV